jgi:gamma-glutamylcyclotransferase (GGCT)/AIG2-like uncharacterized protein YtfP
MNEIGSYLFVYGTLLNKKNELGAHLNANCIFYTDGKFNGKLYNIGEYPGAILIADSDDYVYGKIFMVTDQCITLQLLDDYEGFGADQPQPNEFTRKLISIKTSDKVVECWVYLYNLPVDGLSVIESGKYLS